MSQFLNETFSSGSFLVGKTADVGGTWSNPTNNWGTANPSISGGLVNYDATSPYSYTNSATPGDSVQDISLEWTPQADNWLVGCVARYQTTGGAQLLCWINSSTFTVVKLSSSTDWPGTTLCTATPTIAAGNRSSHTLRFKVDASGVMSVWLDSASVTLTGTTTDNTLTASGSKVGMWGRGASSTQITADDGTSGAATLSAPTQSATGPTHATIGLTTDTPPTTTPVSYQILPAATAAPGAAAIVATPDGTISTGSAGALTKALTTLTTGVAVKAHFAQGASSNVVSTASFTPSTLAWSGTYPAQSGTAGSAFTHSGGVPSPTGGIGTKSYSATGLGASGLTMNSSTGQLQGTCGTAGTYTVTPTVTDQSTAGTPNPQTVSLASFTLTIASGGGGGAGYFNLNSSVYAFEDNITQVLASVGVTFWASDVTTGALVGSAITGLSTNASGIVTSPVTNPSIVSGTTYRLNYETATGKYGVVKLAAT